ncbi:MAG TPA: hypothetical protein P5248_10445, partial [Bacteroidales bacterium]|nr:hypothetical protein [Bacteroidales bacterium]
IDALIDKLSNELRLKNQELYPMRILDEPFDHSLSYLVEILSNRKCEVAMNYEIRSVVPERIRIHLYRVIQELLLNAIKHVAPPYIQIEATEGPGWIELSLYYPNPGEKELKIKRSRRGQSIIGERLRYINGTRSYELSEQMTLETITVKL